MQYTPEKIGDFVRTIRKELGITQKDLALTSGTGLRFIIDLEKGKATCQLGKVLTVLHTLGFRLDLTPPWVDDPWIRNARAASDAKTKKDAKP